MRINEEIASKNSVHVSNISVADEIIKFKGLCDEGIITTEEFETKKRELLGQTDYISPETNKSEIQNGEANKDTTKIESLADYQKPTPGAMNDPEKKKSPIGRILLYVLIGFVVLVFISKILSALTGSGNTGTTDTESNKTEISESDLKDTEEASVETNTDKELLPFPDESEIKNVKDYISFYEKYKKKNDGKWYRLTMPVYSVSDDHIIVYDGLNENSLLNFISVSDISSEDIEKLHKGDQVTVVAYLDTKLSVGLMFNNGFVEKIETTENTITDEIIVIDDYVDFYNNYSQNDIGKKIQITAKINDLSSDIIYIKEGLPDDITSLIGFFDVKPEDMEGLSVGDTVTVVGTCASKIGKSLTLNNSYVVK